MTAREAAIAALVATAPPLSPEQAALLSSLLDREVAHVAA